MESSGGIENQSDSVFDIHQKMLAQNVLLAFTGEFNAKVIDALLKSVKIKLEEVENISKIQKRVYNIMMECLEFILNGIPSNVEEYNHRHFTVFMLRRDKDYYNIITGTYVLNKTIEFQKQHFEAINSLDKDGKQKLFLECLTDGHFQNYDRNLAILDIAMKSDTPLEYEFKHVDSLNSFCTFKVKIKANQNA